MSFINNELSKAVRLALTLGAAAGMVASTAAIAQDDKELDTITVVGSRIKRVDIETSQPVFTLEKEDIKATGLTSIGDIIQNLTTNGSTLNSTFNNGGNGETRVSLRNLGSNRTLVLVNGHRWVPGTGLGGAVDLNTIPTAAVERVEVLKDGASSIYGSDAIAGVVNIILRTDYDGAEANLEVGEFEDGDGQRQSYDFTIGTSTEKGSLMFSAAYVQEDPVFAGDRAVSAEPQFGTGVTFGSSTSPFGRFQVCNGQFINGACRNATNTGAGTQTQPGGAAGQFTYNPGASGTNFRRFNIPGDFFNFAPLNYLLTPQERTSIFTSGSYNFSDNLRFTTMAVYNERKSEQLLAAIPIVLGTVTGNAIGRLISISPQSVFNPFGLPVTRIQRRAVETGGRLFEQNVKSYAFNGTFEGNFEAFDRGFSWDAGYTYAKNDQNDTETGQFNLLNLRTALGPSFFDAGGVARCGTPSAVVAGCVPINLLGAAGTITPEALAYSTFEGHDRLGYELVNYFANITGDIFELPAGPLAFAAGYEYRKESGFDSPDAIVAGGATTGNGRNATRGVYSLDEYYIEFNIPVLKDIPFFQLLEFSVASRYSDYSNFGDTTNNKVGFKWKPIDDLLFRGNYAEGFRAPSIGEAFQGVSDNFPTLIDRCSNAPVGNNFAGLNATQQQRCIAAGVTPGGYDQINAQIGTSVGGNPNLQPETATNRTLGLVYSPSYIEGLDIALDWYNIQIDGFISGLGAQTIVDQCIFEGNANACALITRGPGGQIINLLDSSLNLGSIENEGWDLTVSYRLPEFSFGQFSLVWDNAYVSNYDVRAFANSPEDSQVGEYSSRNNNWRVRSNFNLRWELGDWGASYGLRYYSRQDEEICGVSGISDAFDLLCNDPDGVSFIPNPGSTGPDDGVFDLSNQIGGTTYHDIQVSWQAPWNAKVAVGINNFTDKEPPLSTLTFANSFDPQYEVPGRFWYVQYAQRF
ncbi:MAG: TonB-dependent receptor [Vicinamibacterales bacterium]